MVLQVRNRSCYWKRNKVEEVW